MVVLEATIAMMIYSVLAISSVSQEDRVDCWPDTKYEAQKTRAISLAS